MTVTAASRIHNVCRISRDKFASLLVHSPVIAERDPGEYWDAIRAWHVDPLFLLAMFNRESSLGTQGTATISKSWGNTRRPSYGVPDVGAAAGRSGEFSRYATWLDGCIATAARLVTNEKPYYGKTIAEVIGTWAPASDGNSPTSYINGVVSFMNANQDQEVGVAQLTDRVDLDWSGANRPGLLLDGGKPTYITIHNTANRSVGANAEMHRKFVRNGGGSDDASFHAVVDDRESIQLLNWNERGYHIGDGANGPGCRTSIGIEVCENADGKFQVAAVKCAKLVSLLLREFNLPKSAVRTHGSWWSAAHPQVHQNCPQHFLTGDLGVTWEQFMKMVAAPGLTEAVKVDTFRHAPGFMDPINDTFNWEGAGIVTYRKIRAYNDQEQKFYEREWSGEGGFSPWVEVK